MKMEVVAQKLSHVLLLNGVNLVNVVQIVEKDLNSATETMLMRTLQYEIIVKNNYLNAKIV